MSLLPCSCVCSDAVRTYYKGANGQRMPLMHAAC